MSDKITQKQEIFCQEWLDNVGNGTLAALVAFDIKDKEFVGKKGLDNYDKDLADNAYKIASSMATEYLRKPSIIKRIDELLEERGFNDDAVKREHFKLIREGDENIRMRAIDSYYKLKGKFVDKLDVTSKGHFVGGFNFISNDRDKTDNKTTTETGKGVGETS